jgi:hypothetical protein
VSNHVAALAKGIRTRGRPRKLREVNVTVLGVLREVIFRLRVLLVIRVLAFTGPARRRVALAKERGRIKVRT